MNLIVAIISILTALSMAVSCFYVMRYNLHMFQQNAYHADEHFKWVNEHLSRQRLCITLLVLFVLYGITVFTGFERTLIPQILLLFFSGLTTVYYRFLKKTNTKKKLVFTSRIKRMVATDGILLVLVVAAFVFGLKGKVSAVAAVLLAITMHTGLQPYSVLLSNWLNTPAEKGVKSYYINDAKRMLKKVPDLTVIGITGSYGKTSVKYYLNTLLSPFFEVLMTPESFNTPMGVVRTVREHLKDTHQIFLCEMGARHVGDIKEITDIVHPVHGVITSVGPQHLETFFTTENIQKTKFELADALPEGGMLWVNGDSELAVEQSQKRKASGIGKENTVTYHVNTVENGGGYRASDVSLSDLGTKFTVTAPNGESAEFQMKLIGEVNVLNVTGAIAVANSLGVSLEDLRVPVRRLQQVPHRMQILPGNAVATIIDDAFNSNPAGSRAAVETLALFKGQRILITPGMVELGEKEAEYNYLFGTYAAASCDVIILIGAKHTEPIRKGVTDSGFPAEKCLTFETLQEGLKAAYAFPGEEHKYILLENDLPDNYGQ